MIFNFCFLVRIPKRIRKVHKKIGYKFDEEQYCRNSPDHSALNEKIDEILETVLVYLMELSNFIKYIFHFDWFEKDD